MFFVQPGTYYRPPSSGTYSLEPPLEKKRGTLTIGYGSGGMPPFSYSLSGAINVSFLKLLVSTRPLNSSTATSPCLCSSDAQYGGVAKETWGTITIPMIQRSVSGHDNIVSLISFLPTVAKFLNFL